MHRFIPKGYPGHLKSRNIMASLSTDFTLEDTKGMRNQICQYQEHDLAITDSVIYCPSFAGDICNFSSSF